MKQQIIYFSYLRYRAVETPNIPSEITDLKFITVSFDKRHGGLSQAREQSIENCS